MSFNYHLKYYRKNSQLKQKELADLLHVSQQTIAKWENGKSEPDISTLKEIANLFKISVDELIGLEQSDLLNANERKAIREVHELSMINFETMCDTLDEITLSRIHSILFSLRKFQNNPVLFAQDKQKLFECICALIGKIEIYADELRYAPENAQFDYAQHNKRFVIGEVETIKEVIDIMLPSKKPEKQRGIVLPFYSTPVSAGVGSWLSDDVPTEWITLPRDDETSQSDMILEVRGDSMEPMFHDGEKVLVKSSESIHEGEIGVFIVDGESYIKKMGKQELISLNSAYSPIKLTKYADVHCVGKVISAVKAG